MEVQTKSLSDRIGNILQYIIGVGIVGVLLLLIELKIEVNHNADMVTFYEKALTAHQAEQKEFTKSIERLSVRVASNSEYNSKLEDLRSSIKETNAKIDLNVKYINETGKVVAIVQNQQDRIQTQLKELNEWLRKQDSYHGSIQ